MHLCKRVLCENDVGSVIASVLMLLQRAPSCQEISKTCEEPCEELRGRRSRAVQCSALLCSASLMSLFVRLCRCCGCPAGPAAPHECSAPTPCDAATTTAQRQTHCTALHCDATSSGNALAHSNLSLHCKLLLQQFNSHARLADGH